MTPEQLFFWAMVDLDACLRTKFHYHQMRMAALLRLLLTDKNEPPLLDQLRPRWSFHPQFRIVDEMLPQVPPDSPSLPGLILDFSQVFIDPELLPAGARPSVELGLDQFLCRVACRANGIDITVRDIIDNVGYVSGVMHAGKPNLKKRPGDAALLQVRQSVRGFGNTEPALALLKQIGAVVRRGTSPLLAKLNDLMARGFPLPRFDYGGEIQKARQPDGSWHLHDVAYGDIIVTEGRDVPGPTFIVRPGAPSPCRYVQFEIAGQIWRAYSPHLPSIAHADADTLADILRTARRVA